MPSIVDELFADVGMPCLDHFAGTAFTYIPKGGPSRVVRVLIRYEQPTTREGTIEEKAIDRMWVTVSRDPATGIPLPQWRDAGLREFDQDNERWSYQGERRNEKCDQWELLFGRARTQHIGHRQAN
jgi:hypothetical protein